MYTLSYIANRTFEIKKKKHKNLYFTMIDFKKAYDSVDRRKLLEVLVKYNVNTKTIEINSQIHKGYHYYYTRKPRVNNSSY